MIDPEYAGAPQKSAYGEKEPPCVCELCALQHGDQALTEDEWEIARLKALVAHLQATLATCSREEFSLRKERDRLRGENERLLRLLKASE